MGCASSAYSKPATIDTLSNDTVKNRVTSTNALPTEAVVLKDMPDVVEKVIDVIKDTDAEMVKILASDSTFENSSAETILNDVLPDKGIERGLGFLDDNDSLNLSETMQDDFQNYKVEGSGLPVFQDFDSLDTSSPESEIEQALTNNNGHNPPTPKPTLSELEDLYILPTSNIGCQSTSNSPIKDNNKYNIIYSINKFTNTPIILCEPTDWEKQADMLASTRKYNPIEAMRKLKRGSSRATSSLPQRDFKPRSQHCIEESLNDLFLQSRTQSPIQSGISSAKNGRDGFIIPSTTEADMIHVNKQGDRSNSEAPEVRAKRHNDTHNKRKELHLPVTKNGTLPTSPRNFKVRERCAVCCNKYKT